MTASESPLSKILLAIFFNNSLRNKVELYHNAGPHFVKLNGVIPSLFRHLRLKICCNSIYSNISIRSPKFKIGVGFG